MDISKLTLAEQRMLSDLLKRKETLERFNKLAYYFPENTNTNYSQEPSKTIFARDLYPKHMKFFEAGKNSKIRIFSASNRSGKTLGGCYELALHATGLYPDWWKGWKVNKAPLIWAIATTKQKVGDALIPYLLGQSGLIGSGFIPKELIIEDSIKAMPGVSGGISEFRVKHVSGGESRIVFKGAEQEQAEFAAAAVDFILLDEEPPLRVYSECLMRTITTSGRVMLTFTADKGLSETVLQFFKDGELVEGVNGDVFITSCSIYDVPHLTDDMRRTMLANCPPHLASAKIYGKPYGGEGLVFALPENDFVVTPTDLTKLNPGWAFGLDIGKRLTSAVFGAYDRVTDTWYITKEYQGSEKSISEHAVSINVISQKSIKGIIDKAALQSNIIDMSRAYDVYRQYGVDVYPSYNSPKVEVSIQHIFDRLKSGRLKIFSTCQKLLSEMRLYRRDDKMNLKGVHDTIDALRYLIDGGQSILTYFKGTNSQTEAFNYLRR